MGYSIRNLEIGDHCVISGFRKGNGELTSRLLSMGITVGVEIELIRKAPFGDPIDVRVRGFELTLRKKESDIIKIRRV